MGEIAGEGGFGSMDPPSPPGMRLDTGEFLSYQGPGNFTDIGGFTPSQVGYTTEHGDFIPYDPTDDDELGNHYPIPQGPYNSPIYGEGYIDEDHVFHPKFGIDGHPATNQLGPAPDTSHSATLNIPGRREYSFLPVSLSEVSGIPSLNRNYPDGKLKPSVSGQSTESLWMERGVLIRIIKIATPEEIAIIERFNSNIYPDDLFEFLQIIRNNIKDSRFSGGGLDQFLDYTTRVLREKRVSDLVDRCAYGLYFTDREKVRKVAEESVKMKIPDSELGEYLIPKIEHVLQQTDGYAGYYFDEYFLERNKQIKQLDNAYRGSVFIGDDDGFRDAIIKIVASGLKGDALRNAVRSKAHEFDDYPE